MFYSSCWTYDQSSTTWLCQLFVRSCSGSSELMIVGFLWVHHVSSLWSHCLPHGERFMWVHCEHGVSSHLHWVHLQFLLFEQNRVFPEILYRVCGPKWSCWHLHVAITACIESLGLLVKGCANVIMPIITHRTTWVLRQCSKGSCHMTDFPQTPRNVSLMSPGWD